MANKSGPQPKVKYCPACKGELENVPRSKMKTTVKNKDGTVPPHTHTYAKNVKSSLRLIKTSESVTNLFK